MNIDCQIRGKSDIYEALSTMCEVDIMQGDNKVFCDKCKKKCDTVLRTAISELPNVLILSLKRFDLDYNTFETVKLNSRCAFGQTLNMKQFTLEGIEAAENAQSEGMGTDIDAMIDAGDDDDEDYKYRLAGVLVHAGVAQGGHYYSFIKDRSSGNNEGMDKWYRFDDEDVTPFDPSMIEIECFGGKVKKETKWPNGQVHTVESEQFANALMLFYEKVKPSKFEEDVEAENQNEDEKSSDDSLEMKNGYDIFQSDVREANATHNWHAFLLDTEFQTFLLGMVELCLSSSNTLGDNDNMDISTPKSSPLQFSDTEDHHSEWCLPILDLSLQFFFDVLLHSAEKDQLNDWVMKLSSCLSHNRKSAKMFVHELAIRTQLVSGNWLRTFCSDCPEENSRGAALQLIANAMKVCAEFPEELKALEAWSDAWSEQMNERNESTKRRRTPVPNCLESEWQIYEDCSKVQDGLASSIGIIISYVTKLLDLAPRFWRNIPFICALLNEIATLPKSSNGDILRKALVAAQVPARLICLATRERSPTLLIDSFPGASVSMEIAEALVKTETNPSSHLLPLTGNSVGMSGGVNPSGANSSMPSATDYTNLFEALASIIGICGTKRTPLISCMVEFKGRAIVELSKITSDALTSVFNECKSSIGHGMNQGDIQNYMKMCGIDTAAIPQQRIASILNKYSTVTVTDGDKNKKYLTLEGFLTYYRDTVQSNEVQVSFSSNHYTV